jgi:hypothetical protein
MNAASSSTSATGAFAGRQLIESAVRLHLLEHQLDLPARGVQLRDVLGVEYLGVDVLDVESVLAAVGMAYPR